MNSACARFVLSVSIGLVFLHPNVAAAENGYDGNLAMSKLGRGVVNIFTGWVELPKRMIMTGEEEGTASALTLGLIKGIYYGLFRTAAGFYEGLTFPFPAPPNYAPIIEPTFVFETEDNAGGSGSY